MRKKILTVLFAIAMTAFAGNNHCAFAQCDSIIFSGGGNSGMGGGPRGLTISELRACIVSFGDNVYVVVTVLQDLGQMEYSITNTSTGWYLDGEINAVPGSYPIPISGSPGFYTISFILPDGRSCYGAFTL